MSQCNRFELNPAGFSVRVCVDSDFEMGTLINSRSVLCEMKFNYISVSVTESF